MTDNSNIIEFRTANENDKSSFIDLWKICFEDTEDFIKWFFENRFFPEYSICGVMDGMVVCAMQSMPMPIWIRGKSISGAIVVGVCTHPNHRGRHYMKNMFTYYMEQMRQKRIFAITYKPENIQTYFSLGHYPTTRTIHLSISGTTVDFKASIQSNVQDQSTPTLLSSAVPKSLISSQDTAPSLMVFSYQSESQKALQSNSIERDILIPEAITVFKAGAINDFPPNELKMCFDLYTSLASRYSGMVDRDMSLFSLKSQDYASVDGRLLMCFNNPDSHELIGYCFYFDTEKEIYGEELLAKNDFALKEIINNFCTLAKGKDLKLKIPPDFSDILNDYHTIIDNNKKFATNVPHISDTVDIADNIDFTSAADIANFADITEIMNAADIKNIKDFDNSCVKSPQNVMGVSNINEFVRELDLGRLEIRDILKQLVVEVRDPILPENSVKMNLLGENSSIRPCISVETGYFVQILCGYCNLFDFISKGDSSNPSEAPIIIYEMEKAKKINEILCPCECFIVDEY